jgi:RNA-binding protein YhbY
VKGRVQQTAPAAPEEVAAALASAANAALVGAVGHTFLLYRPNPERKDRILLP